MTAPTLRLKIKTDNAAFEDDARGPELARILRKVAEQIEEGDAGHRFIFDINGNAVGDWVIK